MLGPDEIQIKSSRRNLKTAEGLLTDIIVGDVLVRCLEIQTEREQTRIL